MNELVNKLRFIFPGTGPSLGAAVVEREDLLALTHDVRNFKEALAKLQHVFAVERGTSI